MVEFNYQIKSARRELNIRQNREVSIMKHKLVSVVLAAAMLASSLTGCGSKAETTAKNDSGAITLKVFSNLPDRKNGQGLVEQMIIDDYMKENTNVKIEVEALDEEAYKTKFKAYSMEGMRIMALSPVPWKALRKMESCMAFPETQTWPASIIMRKCLRTTAGMYPQRMMNY